MHCVAASRRENRTRRFWTTYCNRLVTTSGFCRRSKVQRGSHFTAKVKATKLSPLYPNDPRSSRAPQTSPAYQEHRYHFTASYYHSSLLTPRHKNTSCKSMYFKKYDVRKVRKQIEKER